MNIITSIQYSDLLQKTIAVLEQTHIVFDTYMLVLHIFNTMGKKSPGMFYQAVVTLYQLTQHNIPEGKTSTAVL